MIDCCRTWVNAVINAVNIGANSSTDSCVRFTVLALAILGFLQVLSYARTLLNAVLFFAPGKNPRKYGKWAVVTGATDGIGLGYAKRLASKGMNVVLISRDATKLAEAASQLAKYKIEVKTIAADFSKTDIYDGIAKQLEGLEIGVLINNVGRSYDHAEYFSDISAEQIENLLQINIRSTTYMTRIVLPAMLARKRGAIINVGSAAGILPTGDPLYAVYSATKGYVDQFSRSLHWELKHKGIFVQNQVPYFVTSKLSKIRHASIGTPNPSTYAAAAVGSIGTGGPSTTPFWAHAFQHFLYTRVLPEWVFRWALLSHHHGIRAKALKKKKEAAGEKKSQ